MDTEVLISHTIVTLNEGQGHPNRFQNVEHSSLNHQTMIERNRSLNIRTSGKCPFTNSLFVGVTDAMRFV